MTSSDEVMTPCVRWRHVQCIHWRRVQWSHVFIDVICSVTSCVHWRNEFNDIMSSTTLYDRGCHVLNDVICSMTSCVQWCHVFDSVIYSVTFTMRNIDKNVEAFKRKQISKLVSDDAILVRNSYEWRHRWADTSAVTSSTHLTSYLRINSCKISV